jgi:multidrug efflux system outer membrane protein
LFSKTRFQEFLNFHLLKNYQIAEDNSNISLNSFLIDENLKTLVNLVLENNKDIKIALLRVEESKSLYRIEESNLYPKIDANGSFSRDKKEEIIKNSYKASVGTVFELDLFGKNRSLNDAAKNSFLATQYALSSTKLSLISQTINSYLSLATNIENLNLQKKIYENLSSVYELTQKKFTAVFWYISILLVSCISNNELTKKQYVYVVV